MQNTNNNYVQDISAESKNTLNLYKINKYDSEIFSSAPKLTVKQSVSINDCDEDSRILKNDICQFVAKNLVKYREFRLKKGLSFKEFDDGAINPWGISTNLNPYNDTDFLSSIKNSLDKILYDTKPKVDDDYSAKNELHKQKSSLCSDSDDVSAVDHHINNKFLYSQENSSKNVIELGLSNRATNALVANGITTYKELMNLDFEDLLKIRNIGNLTFREIITFINENSNCELDSELTVCKYALMRNFSESDLYFIDSDGNYYEDIDLSFFNFSARAKNVFKKNNINSFRELACYDYYDFVELPNLGKTTIKEILEIIRKSVCLMKNDDMALIDEYAKYIENSCFVPNKELMKGLLLKWLNSENYLGGKTEECIKKFLNESYVLQYFTDVASLITIYRGCTSFEDFYNFVPASFCRTITNSLEQNSFINIHEDYIFIKLKSITDYAAMLTGNNRIVLDMRFTGHSLQDVAEFLNLTRERVRQLQKKLLDIIPFSYEDLYKNLFEMYQFDDASLKSVFDLNYASYFYLDCISDKHDRKPIKYIFEDKHISDFIKERLVHHLNLGKIELDGKLIYKRRRDIVEQLVKRFQDEDVSIKHFSDIYNSVITDLGVKEDKRFKCDERSLAGIINRIDHVLWKLNQRFRYLYISYDRFCEFLDELALDKYNNMELSTKKIFIDNTDLMKQFDIRDEYELHNLLRNRLKNTKNKIQFLRMPNVRFGNASRKNQVINILKEYKTIKFDDFCKCYTNKYGVSETVVAANYVKYINKYLHNGSFIYGLHDLSQSQYLYLGNLLVNDMHSLESVKAEYDLKYPNRSDVDIRKRTLKKLGYTVSAGIIYKSTDLGLRTFLENYFRSRNIVNLTEYEFLSNNLFFKNFEYDILGNYDYFKFSKLKYISLQKLTKNGYDKTHIYDFIDTVREFCCFPYFNITSLRKSGFQHSLLDTGFDDCFFNSLFEYNDKIYSAHFRGSVLFSFEDKVNKSNFIIACVNNLEKCDIYDFLDILKGTYNMEFSKSGIIGLSHTTDMFYSSEMEKIYKNYECFLEDL